MTVSYEFPKKFLWLDEGFPFSRCKVSTNKLGNFLTKYLSIKSISGFLRRKLFRKHVSSPFGKVSSQVSSVGRMRDIAQGFLCVSYWFPKKFPHNQKSFLNHVWGFHAKKQETFDGKPSIHAGVYGFLGWKPFPGQETLSFLESFQRRNESCLW